MTNVVEFYKTLGPSDYVYSENIARLDGQVTFSEPLIIPPGAAAKMQVLCVQVSDRIPNVFDATGLYDFNNTIARIGVTFDPDTIQVRLERGLYYDVSNIADAINTGVVASGKNWYASASDPPLTIEANTITDRVIVRIDSTKLAQPGYMLFDIRKGGTGSDLGTTLGFSEAASIMISPAGGVGTWYSDQTVRMDTQGTSMDIRVNIASARRRNESQVRTVAVIPFAGKTTVSDIIWPSSGQLSPVMRYDGPNTLREMKVEIKSITGRPMLFMDGSIHLQIIFSL